MTVRSPRADYPSSRSAMLAALQIGLVVALVYASGRIVLPFIGILLWSVILAVLLYPLHNRLVARLGNRWSATLIGIVGVALVLAPTVAVATSMASSVASLVSGLQNHTLTVPPPPPKLATIPVIGERVTEAWAMVASSVPAALAKYGPMLRKPVAGLASLAGRLAAAELQFVLSFAIAAVLVAYGAGLAEFARRLLQLVTGSRAWGERLVGLTAATIRGVALGIVGVAVVQSALLAVGFFAIGLPGAGLLTLAVLLLGIVQVPATLLTLPIIIYVFATEPTGTAIIFAVWTVVAGLSDNVLKPLMLGRGLEAPMPIIFIGVIGGMITDGLLGLFVGPVILAVTYVLFTEWLRNQSTDSPAPIVSTAP